MEFLAPLADALGMTAGQLTSWLLIIAVAVVAWWVLRGIVKFAVRTFAIGCFVIVLFGLGLYVLFLVL